MINTPTFFAGSDSHFFNDYGAAFIRSFKYYNPNMDIHYHLMDPTDQVLNEISTLPCTFSVSNSNLELMKETALTLRAYQKQKITFSEALFAVTAQWYRSQRFIFLSKNWSGSNLVLAYDVDTVCMARVPVEQLCQTHDQGCLNIKGNRVVSLTAFTNHSQLLREWGTTLEDNINKMITWDTMDQSVFVGLSEKYKVEDISVSFCNHSKKAGGYAITGKGPRKINDPLFRDKIAYWKNLR